MFTCRVVQRAQPQLRDVALISPFAVSHNASAASRQQQHEPDQERSREERVRQIRGPLQREGQEGGQEGPQTSECTSFEPFMKLHRRMAEKWGRACAQQATKVCACRCGPSGFKQASLYNMQFAWCKQQIVSSRCVRESVAWRGTGVLFAVLTSFLCFLFFSFFLPSFVFLSPPPTTTTTLGLLQQRPRDEPGIQAP